MSSDMDGKNVSKPSTTKDSQSSNPFLKNVRPSSLPSSAAAASSQQAPNPFLKPAKKFYKQPPSYAQVARGLKPSLEAARIGRTRPSLQMQANAIKAKQRSRIRSPSFPPTKKFWHPQHQVPSSSGVPKVPSSSSGSSSVFSRLGGVAKSDDTDGADVPKKKKSHKKLISYGDEGEEWLPEAEQLQEQKREEEEDRREAQKEEKTGSEGGKVRKSVLRDLGLKLTGDEMDIISRHAPHNYYLRSLESSEQQISMPPFRFNMGPVLSGEDAAPVDSGAGLSARPMALVHRCPYVLPTLSLPAPPTPKGSSAGDFYEALETRDQEIRKGMNREKSLATDVLVGTCPDMCPEKERYRREDTRRLSYFEVRQDSEPRNAKVHHSLAVKEYSGSAADKEEPLPHDLRPLGVLQMTMDYLICMVMDSGRDRPYDWYDFLWNRTRAIRKDITIQRLCSPGSVELVEKCARFHVLCSHHLCEEEITTFDPKMNSENLNKCLLSLKELYRDLRLGQGVYCPNEAEFCCYDILLHLTDGNVLNILQDYSPEVSKHRLVEVAVNAVLFYDSRNFIKFFKLVRSCSYLNACLLHRYFSVVRVQGLRVMNRSHSMQKKPVPFPLRDLARMMAFSDEEEAASFCIHFDLELKGRDVLFTRGMTGEIRLQDKPLPPKKSGRLVLSKNKKCLGEVVNSAPLPPVYRHTPHSSFTNLSGVMGHAQPVPVPREATPPKTPPPQVFQYSLQEMQEVVEELVVEEVTEQSRPVVNMVLAEERMLEKELEHRARLEAWQQDLVRGVAREVLEVVRECVAEEKVVRDGVCSALMEEVCQQLVGQMVQQVCSSAVHDAKVQYMLVLEVAEAELVGVVKGMVKSLVQEEVRNAKKKKAYQLEKLRKKFVINHLVRKCWDRWKEALEERHHIQTCAEAMPPCPPFLTLSEQLDVLLPPGRRRRLVGSGGFSDVDHSLLEKCSAEGERRWQALFSSLDLPNILQDQILMSRTPCPCPSPPPNIYWKLLLLTPPLDDLSSHGQSDLRWICSKLGNSSSPSSSEAGASPMFLLSKTSTVLLSTSPEGAVRRGFAGSKTAEFRSGTRQMNMAVQKITPGVRSLDPDTRRLAALGACALTLFLAAPTRQASPEVYITSQLDLLLDLLSMPRFKSAQDVPLLVVYSSELECEKYFAFWCACRAAFERAVLAKPISEVLWLKIDIHSGGHTPEALESQLIACLRGLCSSCPSQPSLAVTPIVDYLSTSLHRYWDPVVMADSQQRAMNNLPSQSPRVLVRLFNSLMARLAGHASRVELQCIQWPLPEFIDERSSSQFSGHASPPVHWNSSSYLQRVRNFLMSLSFPEDDGGGFPETGEDWEELVAGCLSYVKSLLQVYPEMFAHQQSSLLVLSRVNALLHQTRKCAPLGKVPLVPWDRVLLVCVQEIVQSMTSDLWVAGWQGIEEDDAFGEDEYSSVVAWFRATSEAEIALSLSCTSTPQIRHKRHRQTSDSSTVNLLATPEALSPLPCTDSEERKKRRLDESVHKTRQLVQSYEDQLEAWLTPPELPADVTLLRSFSSGTLQ